MDKNNLQFEKIKYEIYINNQLDNAARHHKSLTSIYRSFFVTYVLGLFWVWCSSSPTDSNIAIFLKKFNFDFSILSIIITQIPFLIMILYLIIVVPSRLKIEKVKNNIQDKTKYFVFLFYALDKLKFIFDTNENNANKYLRFINEFKDENKLYFSFAYSDFRLFVKYKYNKIAKVVDEYFWDCLTNLILIHYISLDYIIEYEKFSYKININNAKNFKSEFAKIFT